MCEYIFENGKHCDGKKFNEDDKLCIIHIELPKDRESQHYKDVFEGKKKEYEAQIESGNCNFEGGLFDLIELDGIVCKTSFNFLNAQVQYFHCFNSEFHEFANFGNLQADFLEFYNCKFNNIVNLESAKINNFFHIYYQCSFSNTLYLNGAEIKRITISDSIFQDSIIANLLTVKDKMEFKNSTFVKPVSMKYGEIYYLLNIEKCVLKNIFNIQSTTFYDNFYISETKFLLDTTAEHVYRKAKKVSADIGDYDGSDKYHFEEQEAIRKQKPFIQQLLFYYPIKILIRYGTRIRNTLISWLAIILSFSFLVWLFNGARHSNVPEGLVITPLESLYFSIVTATTLGYGDFSPKPGFFQIAASLLKVFGTFIWAALIAVVSRKYMQK